jgi:hypothetical protein
MLSPRARDLALTTHVLASVGWFGAVAVFLVLAIAGLATEDIQLARAAYVGAELATSWIIVPLCFATLATGLVQSLGTKWGLFRHYWVLIKLMLTLIATVLLVVHTRPIHAMAEMATSMPLSPDDHRGMRAQLVFDASAALAVFVVATVLAMYKPRGMTRYGRRKERAP